MSIKTLSWMLTALLVFTGAAAAQDQSKEQAAPAVKHVPVKQTSAASGKEMYVSYCAVCHGATGKGDGPAAGALKVAPADLSSLSKNNGGTFPGPKVSTAIRGEASVTAHGSKDMPVWGPLFRAISHGHEGEVQQRVSNLTKYVESLQAK